MLGDQFDKVYLHNIQYPATGGRHRQGNVMGEAKQCKGLPSLDSVNHEKIQKITQFKDNLN